MRHTKLSNRMKTISYSETELKPEIQVISEQYDLLGYTVSHTIKRSSFWTKLLYSSNLIMALLFLGLAVMSILVFPDSMFPVIELTIAIIYIWFANELKKQNRKAMQIYIVWLIGMALICFLAYWNFILLPILSVMQIAIITIHKNTRALFLYSYSMTYA